MAKISAYAIGLSNIALLIYTALLSVVQIPGASMKWTGVYVTGFILAVVMLIAWGLYIERYWRGMA